MKHTSTQRVRVPFKMCLVLFLTISSLMFSKTSKAHNVLYYTPPCFTQGTTATEVVKIANAGAGSYFHWQFRVPGGAWTYLYNTSTNLINGRNFQVTNASFVATASYPSGGDFLAPALTIANVGSPAYTTQLDGVQLRVLMTDGVDPAVNGTVNIWGGQEYNNPYEAKYVTLWARTSAAVPCYTQCTSNALVNDPANPTLDTYFGGFELGGGSGTENFTATSGNCITTKQNTGLTQWTAATAVGTQPATNTYRVLNNPDSMYNGFEAFAPHSGREMMVVNRNNSSSNLVWYRNIATTGSNYFQGAMTVSFWVAKVDATNPALILEINGATTLTTSCTYSTITGANTSLAMTTAMGLGGWQKVSLSFSVPLHTYKKLQIAIRTTNATTAAPMSFAIDDICLVEPQAGILPLVLTPLKGAYSNGVSHLTWSSLQESNSNYFDIERSSDGVNYTAIGQVSAKGISDRQTDYSFNDVKVNSGTNYYRLRAVDKDGAYKNSNIVALDVKIKGTNVTGIYPNPFMDKVNVTVSTETSGQATLRLFDNTGKLIATQQNTLSKGVNNLTIANLGNLAKGFYMIKVQLGDDVITQKIIK